MAEEFSDACFAKVNVDENEVWSSIYYVIHVNQNFKVINCFAIILTL